MRGITRLALTALLLSLPAAAQEVGRTFVDTFEDGSNAGAWTFGTGYERLDGTLGNPGVCLRDPTLVSYGPFASTSLGVQSPFTGDWAARGVTRVGIDLATVWAEHAVGPRTLTLVLMNDNGTPFDMTDDWGAYLVSALPVPPSGPVSSVTTAAVNWSSYDFAIPSQEHRLPEGWQWISRGYARPAGSWTRLMRDVTQVGFLQADPALRYPVFGYDVVLDNPRITSLR